jgi:hypothetical protein
MSKTTIGYFIGFTNMLLIVFIDELFGLTWCSVILYGLSGILSSLLTSYIERKK